MRRYAIAIATAWLAACVAAPALAACDVDDGRCRNARELVERLEHANAISRVCTTASNCHAPDRRITIR